MLDKCLTSALEGLKQSVLIWAMGYDAMNIIGLLEKYSDGHVIDSGCREVGEEEWFL